MNEWAINGDGLYLFSVKNINANSKSNDRLTIWLRILSIIPLFIFLHFVVIKINEEKGFKTASIFLIASLLFVRVLIYFFPGLLQLRTFELFDPSVYGSDIILRSLGDLLINAILFLWVIYFSAKI